MKKIHTKIILILTIFVSLLLTNDAFSASNGYQFEGAKFYARSSSLGYIYERVGFYTFDSQVTDSSPIYRFYNTGNGTHFYTISETEKNTVIANPQWGYTYEGVRFYAFNSQVDGSLPVYRFYNSYNGAHFYTISETEKNTVIANPQWGYTYEDIGFYAFNSQVDGSLPVYRFYNSYNGAHFYTISETEKNSIDIAPVYRFYNSSNGDHFYTISETEKNTVIANPQWGYKYEGIGFYAFNSQKSDSLPVYRFYNTGNGDHFYTISETEKDTVIANPSWGYVYEHVAFFAFTSQVTETFPVYRFYNSSNGDHFYTISESEKNVLTYAELGPEISVGIKKYGRDDLDGDYVRFKANKTYAVKDANRQTLATISGASSSKVKYDSGGNLKFYDENGIGINAGSIVYFESADRDNTDLIMEVEQTTNSSGDYDRYRGKLKIQYTDSSNIWVINTLPMEHYVWGMGEMTGTGPAEHSKLMTVIFRTYGYQYITWTSTIYVPYGFRIRSDSGSQIYYGYDWETTYPNIRTSAQSTRGVIATHGGNVALTPYSSWSDGKTRSFEERWGSTSYPWCKSVSDPYGKHPTMSTKQLEDAGNHMVGLIANGSLNLARDHGWNWSSILNYYYTGINLTTAY